MEASNLLDTEIKTMVRRMLKELTDNYNSRKKDMEAIKKTVRNEEYNI